MTTFRSPRGRTAGRSGSRRGAGSVNLKWGKHLEIDMRKALAAVGALAVEDIETDARSMGKTGRGKPMPALDPDYAKRKAAEGRAPFPDLYRSGELWSLFRVLEVTDTHVTVGFQLSSGDQVKKFRRLAKDERNPLGLSPADLKRFARELVRRGILKEVPGPPKATR